MGLQIRRPKSSGKRILTVTAALALLLQPVYLVAQHNIAAAVADTSVDKTSATDQAETSEADTTIPKITIKSGTGTLGSDPYSRISFKLHDSGKNLQDVQLNGYTYKRSGEWNDLNWSNIRKGHLIQGQNTVVVRDTAGNQSSLTFGYDSIAPKVVSLTHSNDNDRRLVNSDVTSTLVVNEPIQTPDGWTVVAGTNNTTFTKVSTANNKGTMTITDLAGNTTSQFFEVKRIDKTLPTFDVKSKQAIQATSRTITVTEANLDRIEVNGVRVTPGGSKPQYTVEITGEGTHTVTAYDKAGNKASVTVVLDVTAPTFDLSVTKTSYLDSEDVVARVTARDGGSGVAKIEFAIYGVSSTGQEIMRTCTKAVGVAKAELTRDCAKRLPVGQYVVVATAYDAAGNAIEDEDELADMAVAFEVTPTPTDDNGGTVTPPGDDDMTPIGDGTGTINLPLTPSPIEPATRERVTRSTETPQATNILLPTAFGTATPATGSVPGDDDGEVLGVTTREDKAKGEVLGLSDDKTVKGSSNWVLWLILAAAVMAAGWWMIAAARRRKREEGF